jgi:hypothetical protein
METAVALKIMKATARILSLWVLREPACYIG